MPCPNRFSKKSAFTLVELLVVITIISILTGVLLTVIDPIRQRERAQDGTIISTANKIVAAITAYDSAVGVYPSFTVLVGAADPEIQNVESRIEVSAEEGSFSIGGISFPDDACDPSDGYSEGSGACMFKYDATTACLGVKLHRDADINSDGVLGGYFLWSSATGSIVDEAAPSCGT